MSQIFASGGESIGVSASTSVLPMIIQDWYSLMDWLDLFAVQGTLKSLLQHCRFKSISSSVLSFLYSPTLISIRNYWKTHSWKEMKIGWQMTLWCNPSGLVVCLQIESQCWDFSKTLSSKHTLGDPNWTPGDWA